jgi:hypothetical protein
VPTEDIRKLFNVLTIEGNAVAITGWMTALIIQLLLD